MSVLDGGRSEGSHKRVLGPLAEIHETQRLQVFYLYFSYVQLKM